MDPDGPLPTSMADDLAAWGRVITLETRGRHSGRPRRVTIGFADEPSGGMLVAAADDGTQWSRNLAVEPRCQVERDGRRIACLAAPLAGTARSDAIAALILKYGAPSERLGAGPAFRLVPITMAECGDAPGP